MEGSYLKKALNIFNYLLKEGEISLSDNRDLFLDYNNIEVKEILDSFKEEMGFEIVKIGDFIYLMPAMDNEVLGYKDQEIKNFLGSDKKRVDYYLSQYIIVMLLTKFYSGKSINPKVKDFIKIEELESYVSERLNALAQKSDVQDMEEELKFNIVSIANRWKDMSVDLEDDKKTAKTKIGFIKKVLKFLENQKLIIVNEEEETVRTERKLDHLMMYYLNNERKQKIEEVLKMEVDFVAED